MVKFIYLRDGEEPPAGATGYLVTCVPGGQSAAMAIVGGWKMAYTVGADNWPMFRDHMEEVASRDPGAVYVYGVPRGLPTK